MHPSIIFRSRATKFALLVLPNPLMDTFEQ